MIFKVFCCLDFPFLYIHENFLKNSGKQKYCISNNSSDFWVIPNNFVAPILCSYIFTKTFWKNYENKNIIFKTVSVIFKKIFLIIFCVYIKMVNNYQKNIYNFLYTYIKMVKKLKKKNKENLQKEALERCQNLSVEEKKRKKWFRTDMKIVQKKKKGESVNIIGIEMKIFSKKKN